MKRKKNILILSASHPTKTAGIVAKDLLDLFRECGFYTKLIVKPWDRYDDSDIIPIQNRFERIMERIINKSKKFSPIKFNRVRVDQDYSAHEFDETITYYSTKRFLKKISFTPDVILVLFMPGFLSFKNLFEFYSLTGAKILLYPMDFAPLTGGCHWMWDCDRYKTGCGFCPAINSSNHHDVSYINIQFKKKYIDIIDIELLAGTTQIEELLRNSFLFKNHKIHYNPIMVNTNVFMPLEKQMVRKNLNIPLEKKIIFFGAVSHGKRKGFSELYSSLQHLSHQLSKEEIKNTHLLVAGANISSTIVNLPFEFSFIGRLDQSELVKAFIASDIFVSSSILDAGPMMINQSIACGTPVVAFETGVALDLVITGKTGYRANLKDSADLANGIKYILELDDNQYKIMSENCRNLGLELLYSQKQAEKFIEIFNNNNTTKNICK